MAPNYELRCLSLSQFYRKSNDKFYSLKQDSSYVLSTSFAHFGIKFAFFYFECPETNRTKILQKLRCARLQIGVECVKGDQGICSNPWAFLLSLVFENSSQSFIEYSTVTFGFDPCALLPTGYRKRSRTILFGA